VPRSSKFPFLLVRNLLQLWALKGVARESLCRVRNYIVLTQLSVCKLPKWLVTTTTAPVLLKWHDDGTNSRTKRSELPRKIDRALGIRCLDC